MGDRRIGDRREREKGVIKIKFKDAIIYAVIAIILIISIIMNIIYFNLYKKYKKDYETMIEYYSNQYSKNDEIEEEKVNYNCNLSIVGEKSTLSVGESAIFEIKVDNIQAGAGIVMFEALINYDENTFECQIAGDKDNKWTKTSVMEHYFTMNTSNLEPTSENQTIARIKLTAKQDAIAENKVIEFSKMKFTTDDEKTFSVKDEAINMEIVKN